MSEGYTIKEMVEKMDKRISERLDEVIALQKKTNGRVLELEKWRAYLAGAVAVAIAIGIPDLVTLASNI
jgi:hypothetical protein